MLTLLDLMWKFLNAQPPGQALHLVPWHLLLVLGVLGVLSAFGLHFLLGYVFRFYRRKERHARWIAWPSLLVLLFSVQVLLGTYLLAVEAPALVRRNLSGEVIARLGRALLEPAFEHPLLAGHNPDEVAKETIKAALHASAELDYRNRLRGHLAPPQPAGEGTSGSAFGDGLRSLGPSGPDVLVQIGLRWVTAPQNTWFAPLRPVEQAVANEQGDEPFFLPDFLASLIDELQEGTVLPRLDWEHVAGTRFVEGVLRPLVEEYLTYLALAAALITLLLDGAYFLVMSRLKRIGQPRPAKAAPAKAPVAKPAPAKVPKGASPDTTPVKDAGKTEPAPPPAVRPSADAPELPAVPAGEGAATPVDASAGDGKSEAKADA